MTAPLEIAVFNMQVLPQNMGKCVIGAFYFKKSKQRASLEYLAPFHLAFPNSFATPDMLFCFPFQPSLL